MGQYGHTFRKEMSRARTDDHTIPADKEGNVAFFLAFHYLAYYYFFVQFKSEMCEKSVF